MLMSITHNTKKYLIIFLINEFFSLKIWHLHNFFYEFNFISMFVEDS